MRHGDRSIRVAWILLFLAIASCGKEAAPPAPEEPPLDLNAQTQKGWDFFRNGAYSSSATVFRQLIDLFPDAPAPYVGLGWCDVERDSLQAALELFEHALRLDEEVDALAGTVVTASALALDSLAVEASYRIRGTDYIFQGNPQFGYPQVVYLRALGEFHLLRWTDCYASLRILDPELDIDLTAWDFREQLFAALEGLRDRS
jgi:hypothetical protein